jgi:heme/copper-type cytochrome/quinol oxidase subunit 2
VGDFLDFLNNAKPNLGPLAPLLQNAALAIITFIMGVSILVGLVLLLVSAVKLGIAKHDGDPHGIHNARSGLLWSVILIVVPVVYGVVVVAIGAMADSVVPA